MLHAIQHDGFHRAPARFHFQSELIAQGLLEREPIGIGRDVQAGRPRALGLGREFE